MIYNKILIATERLDELHTCVIRPNNDVGVGGFPRGVEAAAPEAFRLFCKRCNKVDEFDNQ